MNALLPAETQAMSKKKLTPEQALQELNERSKKLSKQTMAEVHKKNLEDKRTQLHLRKLGLSWFFTPGK